MRVALFTLALVIGCGDDTDDTSHPCGDGTHWDGDACVPDGDTDDPEGDSDTDADADSDTDSDADADADADADSDADADADADSDTDADADADTDVDCSKPVWFDGSMNFEGFASSDMQAFCDAGYSAVTGHFSIENADTVEPLSCLCEVEGTMNVHGVFTSVDGLRNLRRVGGCLNIAVPSVTDLDGFDDLEEVGDQLYFYGAALTDVSGFPSLTRMGTGFNFPVAHNAPALVDVSGMNALVDHQGISIDRTALQRLTGLTGLGDFPSGRSLMITDNPNLTSITGLSSSYALPSSLRIDDNAVLVDISGLHGVTSIAHLEITDNARLSRKAVYSFLAAVGEANIDASVIDDNGW